MKNGSKNKNVAFGKGIGTLDSTKIHVKFFPLIFKEYFQPFPAPYCCGKLHITYIYSKRLFQIFIAKNQVLLWYRVPKLCFVIEFYRRVTKHSKVSCFKMCHLSVSRFDEAQLELDSLQLLLFLHLKSKLLSQRVNYYLSTCNAITVSSGFKHIMQNPSTFQTLKTLQ